MLTSNGPIAAAPEPAKRAQRFAHLSSRVLGSALMVGLVLSVAGLPASPAPASKSGCRCCPLDSLLKGGRSAAQPAPPLFLAADPKPAPPIPGRVTSSSLKSSSESSSVQSGTSTTSLQGGASSTTLQTGTQSTTLQTGAQSTMLQTGTESTLLQGGTQGAMIQGQVEREAGPVNILFLVDASFSMKEGLGGGAMKMDSAKQVLQNAIQRVPSDVNLGLRVFGQGFSNNPEIDCQQSALLVPMGQGNRRSIIEQVRQIHPFGLTPLTYALMQSAHDLRGIEGPKTVILISDGAETCGGSPCEYIRRLNEMGIKIKVDIIGLGLRREREARAQLNCIAQVSGGKYYDANTAAELIESMSRSVSHAIEGRILTKMSQPAVNTETPPDLAPILPMPSR